MKQMTWATFFVFSSFSSEGYFIFFPFFVLGAYMIRSWSVVVAIAIVATMLGVMNAQADEREPMDYDTCNEHQGDVMENMYNLSQGWKLVKQDDHEWIKAKGDQEVHFICARGFSIIETKPAEVRGQVEYNK